MSINFRQATLPNGLQVIAEVDPRAHSAAIGFFVKTGARDEATSIMGVSHFLEHMMFKGTARRTAEQVDQQFDDLGAEHNAFTTSEMTAFYAHCLPEHLPAAEEILADILRPSLREQDFDDEKKVILEEIAMYADHPFWVLYERTMEEFYQKHPLAHRVLGTDQTVDSMQRDQMMAYFTERYAADNTVVAMAGDLDFDAMIQRLGQHCAEWNTSNTARLYPHIAPAEHDFTIKSAKVNQHYLLMSCPAPPIQDDQRYAAGILLNILGDSEGSRLYWALIETGLAEEAQAQYDGHDGTGQFLVFACCSPDAADEVEQIVRREIENIVSGLTEDDLARVRAKTATAAALQGELPAGRMSRLGRLWTYCGMYRSLESELEHIEAVTLDDLRAVARDYPLIPKVIGRLSPSV